nr:hypothetical protein Iba_chr05fCG15710 [Ipomoea batatas]GMD02347.1 hypothetical protein Iba_chr05fCG15750 [Ipomoea batatas]
MGYHPAHLLYRFLSSTLSIIHIQLREDKAGAGKERSAKRNNGRINDSDHQRLLNATNIPRKLISTSRALTFLAKKFFEKEKSKFEAFKLSFMEIQQSYDS